MISEILNKMKNIIVTNKMTELTKNMESTSQELVNKSKKDKKVNKKNVTKTSTKK